LKKEEM